MVNQPWFYIGILTANINRSCIKGTFFSHHPCARSGRELSNIFPHPAFVSLIDFVCFSSNSLLLLFNSITHLFCFNPYLCEIFLNYIFQGIARPVYCKPLRPTEVFSHFSDILITLLSSVHFFTNSSVATNATAYNSYTKSLLFVISRVHIFPVTESTICAHLAHSSVFALAYLSNLATFTFLIIF